MIRSFRRMCHTNNHFRVTKFAKEGGTCVLNRILRLNSDLAVLTFECDRLQFHEKNVECFTIFFFPPLKPTYCEGKERGKERSFIISGEFCQDTFEDNHKLKQRRNKRDRIRNGETPS